MNRTRCTRPLALLALVVVLIGQAVAEETSPDPLARGNAALSAGKPEEALAEYDRAIAIDAANAKAYGNRGIAKAAMGDLIGGVTDLNRAIELDPKNTDTFYNRARIRNAMEDFEGAQEDYGRAIQLNPTEPSAYFNRGLIREGRGNLEGAKADFAQALKLNPKDQEAAAKLKVIQTKTTGERYPQTRSRLMKPEEILKLRSDQVRYAINEMYARHGADFPNKEIKNQFAKLGWYHGRPGIGFDEIEAEFTDIEKTNVKLLGEWRDMLKSGAAATAGPSNSTAGTTRGERYPETKSRFLQAADIQNWTYAKLRYAINEMYARHGADFPNKDIKQQFSKFSWYQRRPGLSFEAVETEFSDIERENVKLLGQYRDLRK